MEVGKIEITITLAEDGDMVFSHEVTGDLPLAVQLGILEMTKDWMLNGPEDEE